jgi:hypothetical protein
MLSTIGEEVAGMVPMEVPSHHSLLSCSKRKVRNETMSRKIPSLVERLDGMEGINHPRDPVFEAYGSGPPA